MRVKTSSNAELRHLSLRTRKGLVELERGDPVAMWSSPSVSSSLQALSMIGESDHKLGFARIIRSRWDFN